MHRSYLNPSVVGPSAEMCFSYVTLVSRAKHVCAYTDISCKIPVGARIRTELSAFY